MRNFSDILRESKEVEKQLHQVSSVKQLFAEKKDAVFLPPCIVKIIYGVMHDNADLQKGIDSLICYLACAGERYIKIITDIMRIVISYKNPEPKKANILRVDFQKKCKEIAFKAESTDTDCIDYKLCPASNVSIYAACMDVLAAMELEYVGKKTVCMTLKTSVPECLNINISAYGLALFVKKPQYGRAVLLPFFRLVFDKISAGIKLEEAIENVLKENNIDIPELPASLLSSVKNNNAEEILERLRKRGILDYGLASSVTDPMQYPYSAIPKDIWNGKDDQKWALIRKYSITKGYIAIEPYRYKDSVSMRGFMLYCGQFIFVPDQYAVHLAEIVQNYIVLTSYSAALVTAFHYPVGSHVFKQEEADRFKHARMNLGLKNIVSIIRMDTSDTSRKTSSVLTAMMSLFEASSIYPRHASSIYDLMEYYGMYYEDHKHLLKEERYKNALCFDFVAGHSYYVPDETGYIADKIFSLDSDCRYTFDTKNKPVKTEKGYELSVSYPGCGWYIIADNSNTGICDMLVKRIYEKEYIKRYDIHLLYYEKREEGWIIAFISPARLYDICIDMISQCAAVCGCTKGEYEIFSNRHH